MDTLSLALLGISAFFLVFGLIFGIMRGFFRSIVRLASLVIGLAAAWIFRPKYIPYVYGLNINGWTLQGMLDDLCAKAGSFSAIAAPILEILAGVVLFIVAFFVMQLATGVVFFFIVLFISKKKRGLGALVGLVQGALIALCVCIPLNGLILDAHEVLEIEIDGEPLIDEKVVTTLLSAGIDFDAYEDSMVCRLFTTVGDSFYRVLSTGKNADGKEVALTDYVSAAVAAAEIAEELSTLVELDFSEGMTKENYDTVMQLCKNLNTIKGDMDEESKYALNSMLGAASDILGDEASTATKEFLKTFDITTVDFEAEGELLTDLYEYTEDTSSVSATELVEDLADSHLCLPVLENLTKDQPLELPESVKGEVKTAIENLEDATAKEVLSKVFVLD